MLRCSHCATELAESARFCSSCGAPTTSSLSQMPTVPPSPAAGAGPAGTATPVPTAADLPRGSCSPSASGSSACWCAAAWVKSTAPTTSNSASRWP
ncbi:MAG: hypothetical protein DMG28_05195 [Acidobacteria bacterium]|nr:MAG: hypothetical protein DMG28_05195 [Acidobacteriota bacterium]